MFFEIFFLYQLLSPRFSLASISRLAQLVERKTLNLVVEGSSPSVGIFLLFLGHTPGKFFRLKTQTYVVSPTCGIGWMAERSKALV